MKSLRRGEEGDSLGHILCGAIALHGRFRGESQGGGLSFLFAQIDPTRSNTVDRNLRRESLGHGLREHVQRGLGCAVMGMIGPGAQSAERADVDDAATGMRADAATASRATRNGPRALVSKTASHCSRLNWSSEADSKDGRIVDQHIEMAVEVDGVWQRRIARITRNARRIQALWHVCPTAG